MVLFIIIVYVMSNHSLLNELVDTITVQIIDNSRKTGVERNSEIELKFCNFQRDDKIIVTIIKNTYIM